MREVTEQEFFKTIGQLNCHPRPVGTWPYTSEFRTPNGVEVGRIVNTVEEGEVRPTSRYFVANLTGFEVEDGFVS